MRIRDLPQSNRWPTLLEREDFARACEQAADRAEAELASNRAIQRGDFRPTGITKDDRETVLRAQASFESTYQRSLAARKLATTERALVSRAKSWVLGLAEGTELAIVEPVAPSNGIDLAQVRGKVANLRAEIAKIRNAPAPSDRARIAAWFEPGRRVAEAELAQLVGRYPHFLTDPINRDTMIALMMVLLPRDQVINFVCAKIDAAADAVMAPHERAEWLAEREHELMEWLRLGTLLTDKVIADGAEDVGHDPETPPWILLGVVAVAAANATQRMAS